MSFKILMLTSSLGCGGAETHLASLSRALAEKGHRLTVLSSGGATAADLRSAGIRHRTLPLDRKDPLSLLRCRLALASLLKKESFDLIHAHARLPAFLIAPLAKKRRIPFLTTVHADFASSRLRKKLSRWGERAIAVSEDLRQKLIEEYRYSANRIAVIQNGIDTDHFVPTDKPADTQATRLLFVSRMDRDCSRAAFLLCRMAEDLALCIPSLEIHIVGGGNALPDLKKRAELINRRRKRPLLFLHGTLTDPLPLYQSAHAVVGVSRVALEAMSCGLPVILAGNEGMLGILDTELLPLAASSNFCCRGEEELTEERLREEILRLFSRSPEERKRLGEALARYVRRDHSLAKMCQRTESLYEEILSVRPARSPAQIVLCGYYGYGNTGDDALLSESIRRASLLYPDHTLSALTRRGKRDSFRFNVRCVCRHDPLALRRELRHARLLIFGGGTILQDQTSLRSLRYYTAILRYAHRRKIPIELWANGIGMPRTARGERMIASALGLCRRIGLRDKTSLAWALEHMSEEARGRLILEEDLALRIPSASPARIAFLCKRFSLLPPPKGTAVNGFGLITLRGDVKPGYLKIFLSWVSILRAEGIRLLIVPMYPKEDGRICRKVSSLLGIRMAEGLSPSDLVGLASRARIVCGMRLHSLIFAAAAGTPFVGFGSDPKIEAFCREHGGVFFTDLY